MFVYIRVIIIVNIGHMVTLILISTHMFHQILSSLVLTSRVLGDGGGERAGLQIRGCEGPVPLDVLLSDTGMKAMFDYYKNVYRVTLTFSKYCITLLTCLLMQQSFLDMRM